MLGGVTEAIESGDEEKLITTLKDSVFAAATVQDNNASYYITALKTVEVSLFQVRVDVAGAPIVDTNHSSISVLNHLVCRCMCVWLVCMCPAYRHRSLSVLS